MADPSSKLAPEPHPAVPHGFEQPLNERMRMFLRVEFLHRQLRYHAADGTDHGARSAVASLLDILSITGRGDVRADVLKELDRFSDQLGQYRRTPGVDADRLTDLMSDIDAMRSALVDAGKHFMASLRESEFLNAIRHRSAIPGGTCMFDLPEYGYWLQLPETERNRQLHAWISQLDPLFDAITRVLWMTRETNVPKTCLAEAGFYQHSLGKQDNYSLVRVLVDPDSGLYPEISAGSHRFTIRFVEWQGVGERSRQTNRDVEFRLALC